MKKILFLIILLSFLHSYADAQIALTGNITINRKIREIYFETG